MRFLSFISPIAIIESCFVLVAILLFCGESQRCDAAEVLSSKATVNLQQAVDRMNGWLKGDANEAGWRRYLQLNQLDAQCALGESAQVATLQKVLDRFSRNVDGLDAPEFNDVRAALSRKISLLTASRPLCLDDALQHAVAKYRRVSISDLASARDAAVYELHLLKRYCRKTMSSRPRAELFHELALDEQIVFLNGLVFELPPEISPGKTRSLIRDELKKLAAVQEQIDAMPIDEEDEDDDDDYEEDRADDAQAARETKTSLDADDSVEGVSDSILNSPILSAPQPDGGKETLKELKARADMIKSKIKELKKMYRDLKAEDADRVSRRAEILQRLAEFNAGYDKVSTARFDPWFVSTALAAEHFNFLYFYATDDNLQEEFLDRIGELSEILQESPDLSDRTAHGKVGKLLQWLESAGQLPELVSLIRRRHSKPNFHASISSGMINAIVAENAQSVSRRQRVKEVFFGRIVRGTADINGDLSVLLNPDPFQVNLAIELLGSITSQTYSQERNWTINASAAGTFCARREFVASLRSLEASEVISDARVSSRFGGISSKLNLVKRKAAETFGDQKKRNDAESTRRIKAQVTDGFVESTEQALINGQDAIAKLGDRLETYARFVPPLFARTFSDRIELVARKTNQGSLGAPSMPADYGRADEISASIHETMLTNYLDPVFSGKTFTNDELRAEVQERFGIEIPEPIKSKPSIKESEEGEEEELDEREDFSITFDRVRPVQLEFKDDQLAVIVTGRKFAQGSRAIRAGLSFRLNFRIVSEDGNLKLVRIGDTEVDYIDPDKKDAKLVAFRSFIQKRLNKTTETNGGIALPENLLPASVVEQRPLAKSLVLSTLRIDGGWLYLGWNRFHSYGGNLAGVWDRGTRSMPTNTEPPEINAFPESPAAPLDLEMRSLLETEASTNNTSTTLEYVILAGANGDGGMPLGQTIEGELVHEVIVDGTVSEIKVIAPASR